MAIWIKRAPLTLFIDRQSIFWSYQWITDLSLPRVRFCGCGCQMILQVLNGKLVGTIPLKTGPMNQGKLCIKGWNAHEFVRSPNRLTTPLVRKNGACKRCPGTRRWTSLFLGLRKSKKSTGVTALRSCPLPGAPMKRTTFSRNSAGPALEPTT